MESPLEETVVAGRYRLQDKVGSGGMADVYRAVDDVLGRTVAVKLMHDRLAGDPTWLERFRREARAAADLHNEHVVTVYDWGHDDEFDFIVMELVEGEDLGSLMRREGPLAADRVAHIGQQAADALAAAHSRGVIHRDVSPGNILVTADDSAKVADFGIARVDSTVLTQTGSVLGSASYVSPEQAQGLEATPATDLYSLGVVLFEAATGQPPFRADTPVAVAYQHVNQEPPMPHEVLPNVDPRLEQIIRTAMQKEPENRYSSAAEMRNALRAIVGPGPAVTTPMPVVSRDTAQVTETERPSRTIMIWVLLAALIVLLGLGVTQCGPGSAAVSVPAVTGMPLEQATQVLEDAGLEVAEAQSRPDSAKPGTVIAQDPAEGSQAEAGARVMLTVSSGPAKMAVPRVIGLDEAAARAAIEQARLKPVPGDPQYSSAVPAGRVLTQDPDPGQEVAQGSNIAYVLSRGPVPRSDGDDDDKGQANDRGKPGDEKD